MKAILTTEGKNRILQGDILPEVSLPYDQIDISTKNGCVHIDFLHKGKCICTMDAVARLTEGDVVTISRLEGVMGIDFE